MHPDRILDPTAGEAARHLADLVSSEGAAAVESATTVLGCLFDRFCKWQFRTVDVKKPYESFALQVASGLPSASNTLRHKLLQRELSMLQTSHSDLVNAQLKVVDLLFEYLAPSEEMISARAE
jgi:hypothetical protein